MKRIRSNILRVSLVLCLLFALLVGYGMYSVNREGNRWFSSSMNSALVRQQQKKVLPGNILDRNGVLLAGSDADGNRVYQQDETARRAVSHVIGDTRGGVTNGIDSFLARYVYGFELTLFEEMGPLLQGEKRRGDDITLTIDNALCAYIATQFPAGMSGAVVVMNYKTGEVLAELSFPNFDPIGIDYKYSGRAVFVNNAVQLLKAPGSTFKIVTAAAALKNKASISLWNYVCDGALAVGDRNVTCAGTNLGEQKRNPHGTVTLETALVKSCNSAFARLALDIGDKKLKETAENFGFNDNFLFSDIVVENSVYPTENRTELEIAWTGAGQSQLLATPMHMCMIAAAVANDGVMMEPLLVQSIVSPSGRVAKTLQPRVYRTPLSVQDAATLREYMHKTVLQGTGKNADVPGYTICGKTGSAEMDNQNNTDAWFTGFCYNETAPYAVAVVVKDAGGGGTVAAPVAGRIFRYLLGQ